MSTSKANAQISRAVAGHGRNLPKGKSKTGKWYLDPYIRYLPAGLKVTLKKKESE